MSDVNWMCPVDGKVWDNPIAAVSHIYNTSGNGHGDKESLLVGEQILLPEATQEKVNSSTVEGVNFGFDGDIKQIINELEQQGFKTPSNLSKYDLQSFDIIQVSEGIDNDIQMLQKDIEYFDEVFSFILKNIDNVSKTESVTEVEEEKDKEDKEEKEETSENGSGRFTTSDVMEREEREVFNTLRRSTFFDSYSDDMLETFEYVYKKRDSGGVHIDEVANHIGCPDSLIEDNMDALSGEMNLVRHDEQDDTYYIPY